MSIVGGVSFGTRGVTTLISRRRRAKEGENVGGSGTSWLEIIVETSAGGAGPPFDFGDFDFANRPKNDRFSGLRDRTESAMSVKTPSEYSGEGTRAAMVSVCVTRSKSVAEVGGRVDGSERVTV